MVSGSKRSLHHGVVSDDVVSIAEQLVRERFPGLRAAWLGGSAATGAMTSKSDLDITVLLPSRPAPFRESLTVGDQPVELFVHTEESLALYCEQDRRRRRPTTLRLIGTSVVVVDVDGSGKRLQEKFHHLDREGPPALTAEEVYAARYVVTDLLDDLQSGGREALSVAATLWRETAELLLGSHGRWSGTGKWLLRELTALDTDGGTTHADALLSGLAAAGAGDTTTMQAAVSAALATVGGPLFDGYRRAGADSRAEASGQTRLPLEHAEVVKLYGPWTVRTPHEAASLLRGYSGRWWIAGGWAIDAFTGTTREHADLDIGIPRTEAETFTTFVGATLDVWAAAGSLTPLRREGFSVPDDCGNLWLRAGGAYPWEYDVVLEDVRDDTWFYKRAQHISRPLSHCLWSRDGITYLRPEIQLLLKAKHARPKDTLDLERCLPHLDDDSRIWLNQTLHRENASHPWIRRLAETSSPSSRF